MACDSWRFAIPPFAIAPIEKIGGCRCCQVYKPGFVRPATSKIKNCLAHLAPVEVLPCSDEQRGSEAYKRKTGRNFLSCTAPALQILNKLFISFILSVGVSPTEIVYSELGNERLVVLGGLQSRHSL
jgi:hypothetical protein